MDKVLSYLETNENLTPYVTDLMEDQNMLQLLIDCTKFDFIPLKERSHLETLSRGLCYKLPATITQNNYCIIIGSRKPED
jgi:hypothetical protein